MVGSRNDVGYTFLLVVAALVAMASSSSELDVLKAGSAKFAQDLFSALRVDRGRENIVVSPVSLQIALAMLYAGASGSTKTQLAKVLHAETTEVQKYIDSYKELLEAIKDPVLSVASTVFVDKVLKLQDSYTGIISKGLGANVEAVDFSHTDTASKTINDWCSKNTKGRISELFKPADLQGAMAVLANAVHFKAAWKTKFDPANTHERDFKSPVGVVKVQMMNLKSHFQYTYSEQLQAQVLELPYANEKFRMLIVLPTETAALKDVENNLKQIGLEEVMKNMYRTEVDVFLPRFKIEMSLDLSDALAKLGADEMFSTKANFSSMTTTPLLVSKAIQKVFIEVNEEGTEAAAVTGLQIVLHSLARPRVTTKFIANRPFVFRILPEHGFATIFSGVLVKTSAAVTTPQVD